MADVTASATISASGIGAATATGTSIAIANANANANATGAVYYRIHARTALRAVGDIDILPGMVAEVDVITGRRTVMAFVLRPVLRGMARSLSER